MNQWLRTLLVLGRVSNLPTVWSNCLAGWWLGSVRYEAVAHSGYDAANLVPDISHFWKLPLMLLSVSLLYTGGMFLNDAFDEEYDRLRRPERPIPSGKITSCSTVSGRRSLFSIATYSIAAARFPSGTKSKNLRPIIFSRG